MDFIRWAVDKLEAAFAYEPFVAGFLAVVLGMALTETIAHFLPPQMPTWKADRLTRLIVFGVSCITAFWMQPTVRGLVVAIFAGLAAPTLHQLASRWVYARWPGMQPKALIPDGSEKP